MPNAPAIGGFIPEIWSPRILSNLQKKMVYGNLVNRDYEGDIKKAGDTVRINSIGAVTITDYFTNSDHAAPQALTEAQQSLLITEQKMYNFQVDDIEKAQANAPVMEEAMREAAYGLADVADQFIAAKYVDVAAANVIGNDTTPIVPTATTAYEKLVDLGVLLDEANCPADGRSIVVPSWYEGLLLKDNRFVGVGSNVSDEVLRSGLIGRAAGFVIYKSNNVPNTAGTKYKIIALHKGAISFADQITKTESYRPQLRFSDAVKGLHVYGAKTVRPTQMAVLTANKA